jgi:hypothetical protein
MIIRLREGVFGGVNKVISAPAVAPLYTGGTIFGLTKLDRELERQARRKRRAKRAKTQPRGGRGRFGSKMEAMEATGSQEFSDLSRNTLTVRRKRPKIRVRQSSISGTQLT